MNILAFFAALVLFVGGLVLMGYAFDVTGYEALVFFAGVLAVGAAIALPVHVLKRIDG